MTITPQRRSRGDVNDHATGGSGYHVPGGGAITVKVALQVGGEHFLESLVGVFPKLPVAARPATAPGVSHHDVELAVGVDTGVDQVVHLRRVGDIGRHRKRPAAGSADLLHRLRNLPRGAGSTDHFCTRLRQGFCHGLPQAATGAGDDRNFTVEA